MPLSLTPQAQDEVFLFIKKAFSDFPYFDSLIADPIKRLISDANNVNIDPNFTRTIAEHYLDVNAYLAKDQKQLLDSLKIILTATAIHLYSLSEAVANEVTLFTTFDQLQEAYPDLMEDLDPEVEPDEVKYLLIYRNYMVLALKLVPAKGSKLFLLRIMERLEGSNQEYITGTGQKRTVTRRVEIYKREGAVTAIKKNAKRPREIVEAEKLEKERERQMRLLEGKYKGKKAKVLTDEEKEALLKQMGTVKSSPAASTSPANSSVSSATVNLPPLIAMLPQAIPAPSFTIAASASTTIPEPMAFQRMLTSEEKLDAMNQYLLNEPYTGSFTEEIMTHILGGETK